MSKHKCDQSTTLHRSPQVLNGLGETLSGSQSTPTNRGRLANGTQVHFPALTGEAKDCGKSWERSHNVTPELRVCSFTALELIEFTMSPCLRYFSKNSWEETNKVHIQWDLSYKINVVTRARTSLDSCWILFSLPTKQILKVFRKQKSRKASGPDGISPACLKVCADQLAPIFTPDLWSCAKFPAASKAPPSFPSPKSLKSLAVTTTDLSLSRLWSCRYLREWSWPPEGHH